MEVQHWNVLPTFFTDLLERRQPQPQENFRISTVGAIVHVPRAINIRQTRLVRAHAKELSKEGYLTPVVLKGISLPRVIVQEKLDGIFVFWTGTRLLTKAGNHLVQPAFTQFLPKGCPLVGELYMGNNSLSNQTSLLCACDCL